MIKKLAILLVVFFSISMKASPYKETLEEQLSNQRAQCSEYRKNFIAALLNLHKINLNIEKWNSVTLECTDLIIDEELSTQENLKLFEMLGSIIESTEQAEEEKLLAEQQVHEFWFQLIQANKKLNDLIAQQHENTICD